jgi:hypothetical protein
MHTGRNGNSSLIFIYFAISLDDKGHLIDRKIFFMSLLVVPTPAEFVLAKFGDVGDLIHGQIK